LKHFITEKVSDFIANTIHKYCPRKDRRAYGIIC